MILVMQTRERLSEVVEAEGHLIDSQILNVVFDTVVKGNASFEVLQVHDRPQQRRAVVDRDAHPGAGRGRRWSRCSRSWWRSAAGSPSSTTPRFSPPTRTAACPTTSTRRPTTARSSATAGKWLEVEQQRMDAVIVVEGERASCRKLRDVRTGDAVVCGVDGIRVMPEFQERDRPRLRVHDQRDFVGAPRRGRRRAHRRR